MSWIQLTANDILASLAAPQVEALRQLALGEGQADPLPVILADVTARVRAEVRAHRRNRLESNPVLLPPELRLAAVHLVIEALQARLPNLALSPDQVRLAGEARALLARVASGEVGVSPAGTPEPGGAQYGVEVVNHRRNRATGKNLGGL